MNNRSQRKTPPHTPHSHKKRETPPAPPARDSLPPFNRERWNAYWRNVQDLDKKVKVTKEILRANPQDFAALGHFRDAVNAKFVLLSDMPVMENAPTSKEWDADQWWNISRAYELFRGGDVAELEAIIRFLEDDAWFHSSGYLKENIIPAIKPGMLSENDAKRLQAVCLSIVDKRDGREFRGYCNLARKVDSPALRDELTRRLTHFDLNIRRRARWILDAVTQSPRAPNTGEPTTP